MLVSSAQVALVTPLAFLFIFNSANSPLSYFESSVFSSPE